MKWKYQKFPRTREREREREREIWRQTVRNEKNTRQEKLQIDRHIEWKMKAELKWREIEREEDNTKK
jgi:hypothetical protein